MSKLGGGSRDIPAVLSSNVSSLPNAALAFLECCSAASNAALMLFLVLSGILDIVLMACRKRKTAIPTDVFYFAPTYEGRFRSGILILGELGFHSKLQRTSFANVVKSPRNGKAKSCRQVRIHHTKDARTHESLDEIVR